MITNQDILDAFVLIDGELYRIGSQRPEIGKRVVVYKDGLSFNVTTQAIRDVLARLDEPEEPTRPKPRKKRTTKKKEQA